MTSDLRPSLGKLEDLLSQPSLDLEALRRLAPAGDLHLLFAIEMATLLRRGPAAGPPAPVRLLAAAQQAAGAGILPLAALGALRQTAGQAESTLLESRAWSPERPPWWAPLPHPVPPEEVWLRLDRPAESPASPPSRRRLAETFGGEDAPRWLVLPALLDPSLVTALAAELAAAHADGRLPLEREGVGAAGRRSASRWDSVAYLDGREPVLLAAAPTAAAVIQWLLARLGERLADALPGKRLLAPQTAMLARYPAPSGGYHPHLDNPGGRQNDGGGAHDNGRAQDNGRALTLVLYLNPPGEEPAGGELALWAPGTEVSRPPAAVLPPRGGSAALFDSRAVPHQVRPLREGPPRWALTLWLNDGGLAPLPPPALPAPSLTDLLLPIHDPPLPAGVVLFHELDGERPGGEIVVREKRPARSAKGRPRLGLVTTVYRGGPLLDAWCEHHLSLGVAHLVVIFDHPEEPEEAAHAARLARRHPPARLTVWAGPEAAARWRKLPRNRYTEGLLASARAGGAAWAVAARQALHASAALAAARAGELGGTPLDWLLHLDADEVLHLEGDGRGGGSLAAHFAAAAAAGLKLLRYVNHELLLPARPGSPPRFKLNPRLAAARLGPVGWSKLVTYLSMGQSDPRPYFHGYHNGKSAVAVSAGAMAGGVHGWFLGTPETGRRSRFLAGPSVLHFRFADPAAFRRKYLAMAAAEAAAGGDRPFAPSPAEAAAVALVRSLAETGASPEAVERRLDELYREMTCFSPGDVELLEEAGLVLTPDLGRGFWAD